MNNEYSMKYLLFIKIAWISRLIQIQFYLKQCFSPMRKSICSVSLETN